MNRKTIVKHTVVSSLRQAVTGIPFFLAVLGMFLAFCIGGFQESAEGMQEAQKKLLDYGFHYTLLETALYSDAVCLLLPIVSALPFTAAFLEDVESGFVKSYLHRAGRERYIVGKILGCGVSGGLVPVLGVAAYYSGLQLLFLPMEKAVSQQMSPVSHASDVLHVCVLFFCAGILFSLVGMLLSMVTSSRYMAYASPFVFSYVLIILCERYLKNIYILDPREWIRASAEKWVYGSLGGVLWMVMLIFLTGILISVGMYRRIEEL